MTLAFIVAGLATAGFLYILVSPKRNEQRFVKGKQQAEDANSKREIISHKEWVAQLKKEAKDMPCPHPAYAGRREPCKRPAHRPCVKSCSGRTYLDPDLIS